MINLNIPIASGGVYTQIYDVWVGPLGTTGYQEEKIPLLIDTDTLTQGFGIFGEKGVDHAKTEGSVTLHPWLNALIDSPTSRYPLRKEIRARYAPAGAYTNEILYFGDLRSAGYGYSAGTAAYTHKMYEQTTDGFSVYTATASYSNPYRISLSRIDVKDIKKVSNSVSYVYRVTTLHVPVLNPITGNNVSVSWATRRSFDEMRAVVNGVTSQSSGSWSSTQWANGFLLQTSLIVSPTKMKLDILAFMGEKFGSGVDPNELIDYGVLAMRATAKMNANHVNMVAFLRDLRNIRDLIPKLRNLRKWNTHASNYLGVEYGILPTIDDLKSIVRALQGIKPYLDRNGFRVVTAVHNASGTNAGIVFDLEQRIKVAIDKEDEGLLKVINKVDSMGFLLTFENMWDLIPYSFVIDWFLDIGGLLERVDAFMRILRFRIRYSTLSNKRTASITLRATPSFPYSGKLSQVQYHRWVVGHCPEPPLSSTTQESFDHWVEAAALLIQRSKH